MATMFAYAEPATFRIIRLTNVHFDADENIIKEFFTGYDIQDQFRTVNSRSGLKNVVYVLFATIADRLRACHEMSNRSILNRAIKIQPAPHGNYRLNKPETAFARTTEVEVTKANDPLKAASYEYSEADFPTFDQAKEAETPKLAPAQLVEAPVVVGTPTVAAATVIAAALGDTALELSHQASVEDVVEEDEELFDRSQESYEIHGAEMVAADDVDLDLEATQRKTDGEQDLNSTSQAHLPPFIINMTIPPHPENWNLTGRDARDPAHNVIMEAKWYSFENDFKDKIQQEMGESSNIRRILNESGNQEERERVHGSE